MTGELEIGWSPGLNIAEAVCLIPAGRPFAWAFLSVIDSGRVETVVDLIPRLLGLGAHPCEWARGVGFDFDKLDLLIGAGQYLHGFDELWLFDERPRDDAEAPPRFSADVGAHLEPPRAELGAQMWAAGLTEWMRACGCSAGLGDGLGLNYATFEPALAALWRPQP